MDKLTFEIIQMHDGNESTTQTPLYSAITSVLNEFEPNCGVTPDADNRRHGFAFLSGKQAVLLWFPADAS